MSNSGVGPRLGRAVAIVAIIGLPIAVIGVIFAGLSYSNDLSNNPPTPTPPPTAPPTTGPPVTTTDNPAPPPPGDGEPTSLRAKCSLLSDNNNGVSQSGPCNFTVTGLKIAQVDFDFQVERNSSFSDEEDVAWKLVNNDTREDEQSGEVVADLHPGKYTLTASKFFPETGKTITMKPVTVTVTRL